ncbi:hypothetical protein F4678DRAFT_483374 [Xylaria arbuscula]|nr:hypothetical protein F4678DRAFT_483374 [Xylaria arbuscula]
MRWSLINIAGLGLIGLGSVLSGTQGTPVDLVSAYNHESRLAFTPSLNLRAGIISGGKGGLTGGSRGGSDEGGDKGGDDAGDDEGGEAPAGIENPTGGSGSEEPNPGGFASLDKPRSGKTYAPKEVPNPWDDVHKYSKFPAMIPNKVFGDIYKIYTKGYEDGKAFVDQIGINKKDNSINVMNAYNKKDDSPPEQKMYLNDIEMALFKLAGKNPQDLAVVRFDTVTNDETRDAMEKAVADLGKGKVITVKSTDTGKEGQVFDDLLATPFGSNVDRLNQEFSVGKTITSFYVDFGDAKVFTVTLG